VPFRAGGKAEALLTSLALRDRHHAPREALLDSLWPESDLARASRSLSTLVHDLRTLLGDALAGRSPVTPADGGYELNVDAGIRIDIREFDALVSRGDRHKRAGDVATAIRSYEAALQFYRGDVCSVRDVRAIVERERTRACYLSLLGYLADHHFKAADYPTALHHAVRLLGVTRTAPGGNSDLRGNLAAAIDAWNDDPVTLGVIAVMDSRSYGPPLDPTALPEIVVPAGCRLVIVAADWPEDPPDDLGRRTRTAGRLTPSGRRPHLTGPIRVRGTAPAGHLDPGELVLDGLLVEGGLLVAPGNLGGVRVAHTTLVPKAGADSVTVASGPRPEERNDSLRLVLERCISGPLTAARDVAAVSVTDSILDAADGHHGHGVAVTAPATDIQASTVLGRVEARTLDAGNSIFTERVTVERRQSGCVRFCYLPLASTAPRRFRCQPASQEAAGRVVPRFASVGYGQPVYGQLSPSCPDEIARGAEDEGEMGAFHFLQQPRRIDNLRASLDEYLRFGLEAGIFLVT
jgi:hypothetical protein